MTEEECQACFGSGTVERDLTSMSDMTPQYEESPCAECDGIGTIEN